jgi:hypothetical protein
MLISGDEAKYTGYVCAAVALIILFTRLVAARIHQGFFDRSTVVVVASILAIIARLVANQYYLTYGTSNDVLNHHSGYFNAKALEDLKIGTILTLVARFLLTTELWLQNCLLLLFYSRIFEIRARWTSRLITISWILLPITYVAVTLATFLECSPFRLYWQIDPSPGRCVKAYVQLLLQGVSNMILDILLLGISYPLLAAVRQRSVWEQIRVGILCFMGLFCIVITLVRIGYIYAESSYQPVRSFFASVQIAASCFVANTPTIYGCVRMIRRRKSDQMVRRGSRPEVWLQLQATNESTTTMRENTATTTTTNGSEKSWARWVP